MTPDEMLERTQWDLFWVPDDTVVVDRPEVMYMDTPRDVPHLNSIVRLRAEGAQLEAVLGEVTQAHAGRSSRLPVTPHNDRAPVLAALRRFGYAPGHEHDGFVMTTDTARPPLVEGLTVRRVDSRAVLDDAVRVMALAFGRDDLLSEAEREQQVAACASPEGRVQRFVVYDAHGEPMSHGGMTAFPALGFGFLWAGGTAPRARGRGAYSALITARLEKARQMGIGAVGLYARLGTSEPIVAAQGFQRHGRMTFWTRPA